MSRTRRILLMPSPVSSGSLGTVAKALGVAGALRNRGCDVCFVMGGEVGRLIADYGFPVLSCPVPRPSRITQPIRNIIDVLTWTGLADADFVESAVIAEKKAIEEFQPDVVFAETRPTASISVPASKIPLATIASWPTHPDFPANQEFTYQPLEIFNHQLEKHALPPIQHVAELLFLRSDLKLSPSLPELEPELQAIPNIQFVGYMLDLTPKATLVPEWYHTWHSNPLIFIYLSFGAIPPEIYLQTIPQAFAGLPLDVLCACGFHIDLQGKNLPQGEKNVRFIRFLPVEAVIADAALIIFHGGQDTMLTTLLHGLPSIIIPGQMFERQYNASQLAQLGASVILPVHAFRPSRLRQASIDVLSGPYKRNSQKLAKQLQQYGGTEQAVDSILSLIQ